jgi:antitoxin ParD1/3/4
MTITLPPEMASYIQEKLSTGQYASPQDILHEALMMLKVRDEVQHRHLESLRKEIQVGLDQIDCGEVAPLNMEHIWSEVESRLNAEKTAMKEAS